MFGSTVGAFMAKIHKDFPILFTYTGFSSSVTPFCLKTLLFDLDEDLESDQ
jgi:hypothetical protein